MNFEERKKLLAKWKQSHLLRFYEQLNDEEKQILLSQIDGIDWSF